MCEKGECMYVKGECMCVRELELIMSCTDPHKYKLASHHLNTALHKTTGKGTGWRLSASLSYCDTIHTSGQMYQWYVLLAWTRGFFVPFSLGKGIKFTTGQKSKYHIIDISFSAFTADILSLYIRKSSIMAFFHLQQDSAVAHAGSMLWLTCYS